MSALAATWKAAKVNFEKKTGKKKPSDKVLGLFSAPTAGIETSLKTIDTKGDLAGKINGLRSFRKAATAYQKVLKEAAKAAKGEGSKVFAEECDTLSATLDQLDEEALEALGDVLPDGDKGLVALVKDSQLAKLFEGFAKKESSLEEWEAFSLLAKKLDSKKAKAFHETYIAKEIINLPGSVRKPCLEAYEAAYGSSGGDKKAKAKAADKLASLINTDVAPQVVLNVFDTFSRFRDEFPSLVKKLL